MGVRHDPGLTALLLVTGQVIRRSSLRHRAVLAVRIVFCLDSKHAVKARTAVLPRNDRAQLHQFALGKLATQRGVQLIRNFRRGTRHGDRKP